MADETSNVERLGGYRRVRVVGDELVHYAATDVDHAIGCGRAVVAEWATTGDETRDGVERDWWPRCGACAVAWMAAAGQVRLVARPRTALPAESDLRAGTVDP